MSSEIILISDPRVVAVPVRDEGEALVDVSDHLLVDDRKNPDFGGAEVYLRQGVLDRLVQAQKLLPAGLRLLFVEGYRPPSLQRAIFDDYSSGLRALHPDWSAEQIRSAASRYVSPPEIGPHTAGAAVDLTLADADGRELDMGSPFDATPEESDGACYTDAANISEEARANRKVLGAALSDAGMVNYPTEWWHWSYGDRYWALMTGAPAALYGPRELDAQ
ncbi:M15 family metallopeptidase [Streptomyces sp. NPDC047072]|uniref:M15 family metallopeptidase n=1 Tax=Streptomyces sp. NPDC047072 TaxID=3154809 RepID=UPI003409FBC7